MTRDEVLARARELAQEGYQILPVDDPERGMRGVVAFREVDGEEHTQLLEWPMFAGPLATDKQTVGAAELALFVAAGGAVVCDNPVRRLVGFVRYSPEQGLATVRQASLTRLKEASEEHREVILAARNSSKLELQGQSIYAEFSL